MGCSRTVKVEVPKTEQLIFIPKIAERPSKPKFYRYLSTEGINSETNFKRLQWNTVIWKEYTDSLNRTIDYYEIQIRQLEEKKKQLQPKKS